MLLMNQAAKVWLRSSEIKSMILVLKSWQGYIYLHPSPFLLFVPHHCIFSGLCRCILKVGWIAWCFTIRYIWWKFTVKIFITPAFSTMTWNGVSWIRRPDCLSRIKTSRKVISLVGRILVIVNVNRAAYVNRWSNRSIL